MTENKRFVSITDIDLEISIKDNLTKKYPFSLVCENLDEFEPLLNEVINVCGEMNKLWEQTQRFEDHNKRLMEENEQLKSEIEKLSYANEDLLEEKRIWKQMSDEYTKLSYENEQLNLLSNLRGEMVSFATSLIQDMGSEEMLKMWNDFKEVMYQKWKKGD